MAKYDLTWKLGEYFDRHFILPMIEFLSHRDLYVLIDLVQTKADLAKETNMVDVEMEAFEQLHGYESTELKERRNVVVLKLTELQKELEPIVKIFEEEEVASVMHNSRDRDSKQLLDYLVKEREFQPSMLDTLYKFAKVTYDCGNYSASSEYLYFYRLLIPQHHENYLNALWGKLASEILTMNWELAKEDLVKLRAYIDNNPFDTDLELLQQRAWLIHWGLWVFFNHPKGRDDIIEMCLHTPQYLNTVQSVCPHILRYVTVAVVTSKKRKQSLKELVKVIGLESHQYADPVTEFVECLYVNYDFDGAQQKLKECEEVLKNDFFLTGCLDDFIECARLLIFEMFCRIHETISIKMLADKLNMGEEEAERWIVHLIRNAQLNAKIDSQKGHVMMGAKSTSVHEDVMEKTKRLSFRVQQMLFQLEKAQNDKHGPAWQKEHST